MERRRKSGRIGVLVTEDSLTVRKYLVQVLQSDPQLEVLAEAEDGAQAIALCRELRPDVVTMDMMLPGVNGLAATEYIMAHFPTPILIVSSSTNRGELFRTYDALAAGAVDVLDKPDGGDLDQQWEGRLLDSVKLVSRIRVITHPRARLRALSGAVPILDEAGAADRTRAAEGGRRCPCQAVALGASTGGPGALVEVVRALPAHFELPILLVLHIGEMFGSAFADWLEEQTGRPVTYAVDGEPLGDVAGRVAMAPPGSHLLLREGRLRLNREPPRHSCRPSIDVLFESLAREMGPAAAGCLLTGMGKDGAQGLLAIRRAGGPTIAQSEATCVIYGMPREAVALGAAERVLGLPDIGPALAELHRPADYRRGRDA
jgi:two-component system chemotaxis response regulator CheB